jgi:preprotein translocase subunit SecG
MSLLNSVLLVVHLLIAAGICGFVLLQHGKGADMGAAFGSGSSGSVFGAAGSANFLSRTTGILAFLFFASSIGLTIFGSMHANSSGGGLMDRVVVPASSTAPAAPKTGAPPTDNAVPGKAADVPGAAAPATAAKTDAGAPSKSSEVPK